MIDTAMTKRTRNDTPNSAHSNPSIDTVSRPLPRVIACYVQRTIADATRRGYESDVRHFLRHGGRFPATERMVALYLAKQADTLRVATLQRRLASLAWAHRQRRLRSPIGCALVRDTMKGIRRAKGVKQRRVSAIDKPLLHRMLVAAAKQRQMTAARDQALILTGFAGAFRRAELVGLNFEDVRPVKHGIELRLRRAKTDQEAAGRVLLIPKALGRYCPVRALNRWCTVAKIATGPLFRAVGADDTVRGKRLHPQSVALIITH